MRFECSFKKSVDSCSFCKKSFKDGIVNNGRAQLRCDGELEQGPWLRRARERRDLCLAARGSSRCGPGEGLAGDTAELQASPAELANILCPFSGIPARSHQTAHCHPYLFMEFIGVS